MSNNKQFSKLSKSSNSVEYQTPKSFFDKLNRIFKFEYDPATTEDNPLDLMVYTTKEENGLKTSWNYNTYINPPYGKRDLKKGKEDSIDDWINKMHGESVRNPSNCYVMLMPSATETKYFQELIMNKYRENSVVYLIKGRLKFVNPEHNKKKNAHVKGSLLWIKNAQFSQIAQLLETIPGIFIDQWMVSNQNE